MAAITEKQLGQVRNTTGGTAESLYSPGASTTGIIKTIVVCNQTASADSFSIFVDDNGTTYTEETAHFFDIPIAAKTTVVLNVWFAMNDATGNIAVEAATTDAVTFTAYGLEIV